MLQTLLNLDGNTLLWIQDNIRNDILTPVMQVITMFGNAGIFWIILTLAMIIYPKSRKVGITSAVSLASTFIVANLILKNLVGRIRPFVAVQGLVPIGTLPTDSSFPSGHTANSLAVAIVIFCMAPKKYGVPALVLGILISLSRLYLGFHYPSDVIAGAIIAVIIALTAVRLMGKFFAKREEAGRQETEQQ